MNASRTSCFSIELARIRISNAPTSAQHCFKLRSAVPGGQGFAGTASAACRHSPGGRPGQPASPLSGLRRSAAQQGTVPDRLPTAFGNVALFSPHFHRGGCRAADSRTFSPLAGLFTEHTAPELLYLKTRWASRVSFGLTVALLKDVLPIAGTPETVRQRGKINQPSTVPGALPSTRVRMADCFCRCG
jgi:hypothetical protein